MLTIAPDQRRWLLVFGVTLGVLVGAAIWLTIRLPSFRDPAFDFYAMKRDEIFSVYGLTRRQEGSVKLGFVEAYPGPKIGLYGNHIIGAFGADAFGRPQDAEFFFNYFYANLSLPEIQRYLLRVEQKGHLPKELIVVQITPPNADNGEFATPCADRRRHLGVDQQLAARGVELQHGHLERGAKRTVSGPCRKSGPMPRRRSELGPSPTIQVAQCRCDVARFILHAGAVGWGLPS
jgi:hypothetical protein